MQYIGQKEVKTVETLPDKHNGTTELVKVTYADDSTEILTQKGFDISVTEAAADLTSLRDRRMQIIVKAILEIMLEYGTSLADVNFITTNISLSVNAAMNAANAKLWGKDENDLNLLEIDNVIRKTMTVNDIINPSAPQAGA